MSSSSYPILNCSIRSVPAHKMKWEVSQPAEGRRQLFQCPSPSYRDDHRKSDFPVNMNLQFLNTYFRLYCSIRWRHIIIITEIISYKYFWFSLSGTIAILCSKPIPLPFPHSIRHVQKMDLLLCISLSPLSQWPLSIFCCSRTLPPSLAIWSNNTHPDSKSEQSFCPPSFSQITRLEQSLIHLSLKGKKQREDMICSAGRKWLQRRQCSGEAFAHFIRLVTMHCSTSLRWRIFTIKINPISGRYYLLWVFT